jgi:hypothetical protein
MATPTYDLIDSEVLASAASSVTFTSIPGTYRDLILVTEILGDGGNATALQRFNGDSGPNYPYVFMSGNGTSPSSSSGAGDQQFYGSGGSSTIKGLATHQIFDYTATDKHKTVLTTRYQVSTGAVATFASRWGNTASVTQIDIFPLGSNFAAGSTFYLYGIAG